MSDNLKVGLTIGANDEATPVVKGLRNELAHLATARSNLGVRAEHTIQREIQKTQASYNRMARSGKLSEAELARAYNEMKKRVAALRVEMEREAEQTRNNYQRMATARETLGIQSETKIQREIQRTQAAYNRLANSGTLSAQEQERAFTATKNKIASLRKELKGAATDEEHLASLGKKLLVAGGAMAAGAHYLAPKITNSADVSMEATRMANRAFGDRDTKGRLEGKQEIIDAVHEATSVAGGDIDDTMKGFGALFSSKAFTFEQAKKLLPRINKISASVGANTVDTANLATSLHYFNVPYDKIQNALSGAVKLTQEGPVDMGDLARGMPEILEQYNGIGGSGLQGLTAVMALSQVAATGAGSPGQALTNSANLVNDILSPNLDNSAKRIKLNGHHIRWGDSIREGMKHGVTPLEGAHRIVETVVNADKEYAALKKKLKTTTDPKAAEGIKNQMQAIKGGYIGRLFRNQQARLGYLSYDMHYDRVNAMEQSFLKEYNGQPGKLASDADFDVAKQEPAFKTQRAESLNTLDQNTVLKPLADIEGDVADKFTQLDEVLPSVTKSLVALSLGLGTVGAVGGAGIVLDTMLGTGMTKKVYQSLKGSWKRFRGKAAPIIDDVVHGAESAADDVVDTTKKGGRFVRRFAGPVVALGAGAYEAYETHKDKTLTPEQKDKQYTETVTRTAATEGGAEFGAGVGSVVFPGPGTAIGGALGGILGYLGGGWLGQKFNDNLFVNKQKTPNAVMPSDALGLNPQRLDVHLYVDGQELHAALDDRTQREAQRN